MAVPAAVEVGGSRAVPDRGFIEGSERGHSRSEKGRGIRNSALEDAVGEDGEETDDETGVGSRARPGVSERQTWAGALVGRRRRDPVCQTEGIPKKNGKRVREGRKKII